MVETCIKIYSKIDILILNAGVNAHFTFDEVQDLSVYEEIMRVNFFGYLYCTKFAWDHLANNKGQIVVISSLSGELGLPLRSAYCASKFAITGFFEALRIENHKKPVSISIICPPSINTPMREKDLMGITKKNKTILNQKENDSRMSVEECAKIIIDVASRRGRKVKAYLAVYVRPFFPDFVDYYLKRSAKL